MHMLKSFFKTAVWILLANLLVKVTWVLGIEVLMQNALGLQEYGMYYTLLNLSFIFSFFLDFGFARYNSTHTALENSINRERNVSIIRWKFILSAVYLLGTLLLGLMLGYSPEQLGFLLLASGGQVIASYILYFRSVFSGLKNFLWEGIGSVLDRFIMIVLCLLLLWGPLRPYLSLSSYLTAQLAGYLISFLLLGAVWLQVSRKEPMPATPWDLRQFAMIALPFAALVGLESVNDKISIVLLERLQDNGAIEAGKYAFGLRWLDAYKMFASLIGIILIPYYAQSLQEPERIKSIMRPILIVTVFATTLGVSLMTVFSEEVVILLTGQANQQLQEILVINTLSFLPYPIIFALQPLLTVQLKLKSLITTWSMGLVINIIGGLLVLQAYGAKGMSLVFLVSMVAIAGAEIFYSRSSIDVSGILSIAARGIAFGVFLVISSWFIKIQMSPLLALVWCMGISPALVLVFRVVSVSEIRSLLRTIFRTSS